MDRRTFANSLVAIATTALADRVGAAPDMVRVKDFGARGDGVADDSKAFSDAIASGSARVRVPPGRYLVKNVELTNVSLELEDGAILVHVLGNKDVGLRLNSGARVSGGELQVSNSAFPVHGGYGCAIAIGYYADIGKEAAGIAIERSKLTCRNANPHGLAISILGAVSNVRVRDVEVKGAFSVACQAHWGGNFDESHPDSSMVSASAHPHAIMVENLTCGQEGGHAGLIALSLAGVYDVTVKNVVAKSWSRALLLTPGDVYAQVAPPEVAGRILTGILVDGLNVVDPPSNRGSTAESIVLVNGISQTPRTSRAPTYTADADTSIDIRNVSFSNGTGAPYAGAPLVNLYYAGKLRLQVTSANGFADSTSTLFQMRNCVESTFQADRVSQPLGKCMSCDANVNCSVSLQAIGGPGAASSSTARAITCGAQGAGKSSLAAPVSPGDTSVTLNPIGGGYTLVKGTRLYTPNGFLAVARSAFVNGKERTTVAIDPARIGASPGTPVSMTGEDLRCRFSVNASSVYTQIELLNSSECEVEINASSSGRADIIARPAGNKALRLRCGSGQACSLNDGASPANSSIPPGREVVLGVPSQSRLEQLEKKLTKPFQVR